MYKLSRPNVGGLQGQTRQFEELGNRVQGITTQLQMWQRESAKGRGHADQLSRSIARQEVTFGRMRDAFSSLNIVTQHQQSLHNALGNTVSTSTARFATMNHMLHSVADNTVKFGKNMQWAGRQLMVGITLPVFLLGRQMANTAEEIDRQLTRIVKVYDFAGDSGVAAMRALKQEAMDLAQTMADEFGSTAESTLEMVASFAQAGFRGQQVFEMTAASQRVATLGELEHADAINLTRTIMSAFGQDIQTTAADLDRMNSVENNTVLNLKEMGETIPNISGALNAMKLELGDGVAMLAAMRDMGLGANESQTALRTGLSRILKPTGEAVEIFGQYGINLESIVQESGGTMEAIERLAHVIDAIPDPTAKTRALVALFDRRQYARLGLMFEGIVQGARDSESAYARARESWGQTDAEAAAAANEEIKQIQESAAGQMAILRANIGLVVGELGRNILPHLIKMMEVVKSVLDWLNRLPEGFKSFLFGATAIAAVIGPIVMLAGLLANLFGSIGLFATSIGKLAVKMGILTEAQVAAKLETIAHNAALANQTVNLQNLRVQIENITRSYAKMAASQASATAAVSPTAAVGAGMAQVVNPQLSAAARQRGMLQTRMPAAVPLIDPRMATAATAANTQTKQLAQHADVARRNFTGLATIIGSSVGMIGTMATEAGSLQNNIFNVLTTVSMLIPALSILSKARFMAPFMAKLAGAKTAVTGIAAGLKLPALAGLAPALAPFIAALGAAGAAVWFVHNRVRAAEKAFKDVTEVIDGFAETAGVSIREAGSFINEAGEEVETTASRIQRIREEQTELVAQLQQYRDAGNTIAAQNYIVDIAYQMVQRGASMEDAIAAAEDLARAADIRLDIELNEEEVLDRTKYVVQEVKNILATNDTNFWETLWGHDLSAESRERIARIVTQINEAFLNEDFDAGRQILESFSQGADESMLAFLNQEKFAAFREAAAEQGYGTGQILADKIVEGIENGSNDIRNAMGNSMAIDMDLVNFGRDLNQAQREFNRQLLEQHGLQVTSERLAMNEVELRREMAAAGVLGMQYENQRVEIMKEWYQQGRQYTEEELNAEARRRVGIEDINEAKAAGVDLSEEEVELLDAQNEALEAQAEIRKDFIGRLRSSIREQLNNVHQVAVEQVEANKRAADKIFEQNTKATEDSYDDRIDASNAAYDAELKAAEKGFDARVKASDDAYDQQIKAADKYYKDLIKQTQKAQKEELDQVREAGEARAQVIQDQIDEENRLEALREAVFRREQARIDYMSGAAQSNIRFNMAMIGGDLGGAAIIREQMASDQAAYHAGIAAEEARAAVEARNNERQARMDIIREETDAEVEALREVQDARLEAIREAQDARMEQLRNEKSAARDNLNAQKEMRREEIRAAKDAAQEALNAQKDAYREQRSAQKEANDAMHAATRRRMDAEYEELARFVPKTEAEYGRLLEELNNRYNTYGATLKDKSGEWNDEVQGTWTKGVIQARDEMSDDMSWQRYGERVGDSALQGMLGMTRGEFRHWIETGEYEPGATARRPDAGARQVDSGAGPNTLTTRRIAGIYQHTGGPAGESDNRLGRTGALKPDEVPAVLQRGEYVVQKPIVDQVGKDFFDRLNAGRYLVDHPRFHEGGLVGGLGTLGVGAMGFDIVNSIIQATNRKNMEILTSGRGDFQAGTDNFFANQIGAAMFGAGVPFDPGTMATGQGLIAPDHWAPWTTPLHRSIQPYVANIVGNVLAQIPGGQRIISGLRPGATIKGSRGRPSLHGVGKAVDIHALAASYPGGNAATDREGDMIAAAFRSGVPGVREVLWKTMQGGNHYNHVHVGFRHKGGIIDGLGRMSIPSMRVGGLPQYDNTLANLHKGEAVLTKPLTEDLRRGIQNIENSGGNVYNITIEHKGEKFNANQAARDMQRALQRVEAQKGTRRKI